MTPNEQIQRLRNIQRKMKAAQKQTHSRVVRSTRSNLIRTAARGLGMKLKEVKDSVSSKPVETSGESLNSIMKFRPNQPNLRRFVKGSYVKPRGGRKGGLRVKVLGQTKFFEGAFFVTLPGRPALVFKRSKGRLKAIRGASSRGAVLVGNRQMTEMIPTNFKKFARDRFQIEWERSRQRHLSDL